MCRPPLRLLAASGPRGSASAGRSTGRSPVSTDAAGSSPVSVGSSPVGVATTGISLLRYDVTTLYFEAEKEDALRQVGYSEERRVDPQIVLGLLVDRTGVPLDIGCFEGAEAENHTILPFLKSF